MIKNLLWIGLLAFGTQAAWAFSLLGPVGNGGDAWQATVIGYNPLPGLGPPFFIDGQLTGPKNIGEEYRRNTPFMCYACDANFLDFFGSNGVVAVDQVFAILNQTFTNSPAAITNGVDGYTLSLAEFPLQSQAFRYRAQALSLLDLKSDVLAGMMEQLGLADSVRYTWALHNRFQPPNTTCPNSTEYTVIQRNFDITASPLNQVQYSPYVNGVLYTYLIFENCGAPGASPPDADAVEVSPDPLANNPPVASGFGQDALSFGGYYGGLTRDDVAGLRYLLSSNNINTETPAAGTLLENTNNPTTLLTTSDLGALVTSAQTNSPAVVAALFPGVVIASSTSYFTNVNIANVITFATNYHGEPFGTPPHIITITNFTPSIVQRFVTTFANVVVINSSSNSTATLLTTTFGAQVGAPVGSPFVTTTTRTITLTNIPTGDYYVIPAGSCGLNVVHTWLTNVVSTTNLIAFATNPDGSSTTESLVTSFTNHILEVQPCNFAPPSTGLYQGVQRLQFVRANFDSLIGQFFQPVTNTYTMMLVTNSQVVRQTLQRVVTVPDFLFTAADLSPGPSVGPIIFGNDISRSITFDQGNVLPGLAGPGVVSAPTTFILNKVGTLFENIGTDFLAGNNFGQFFLWGSFDGSTNDPVVYPNGTSIANLESEILIQVSPASLPNGSNGTFYTVTLSVTGGQSPYVWSLVSGALPNGLGVSSGGVISGMPSGNPSGAYYFALQMTDAGNRVVNVIYSITIN